MILALLIPVGAVTGWFFAQRALPVMDGAVTLADMEQSAEVAYDECGVPYIEARTDHDVYMAQGFITASDRMFEMDIMRRTALGELSQILGPQSLSHDKLMRTIGFNRLAHEEYKQLPAEMKSNLKAYCQGVNAYIEQSSNREPLEFVLLGYQPRTWEPADTLAILKYGQYSEDESWQLDDLRQRMVDKLGDKSASLLFEQNLKSGQTGTTTNDQTPTKERTISQALSILRPHGVLPTPLPIWGSNAWAVSAGMTDSKGCMLANDNHSAFLSPDRYYLCSLSAPGMHVAGATIPGVPAVVTGRNEHVGWAATACHADTQDLVLQQLSAQFPGKYKSHQGWENTTDSQEDIPVRFSNDLVQKVVTTKNGPVLFQDEKSSTAVCLSWTGFDTKEPVMKTIFNLQHVGNWEEFNKVLAPYSGATRTFVYVDDKGNFGYHVAGSIPVRTGSGATLMPGWTGAGDWHGRVKYDALAHGYNPPQGYAVADNPEFGGAYLNNPLRAIRIGSVLAGYKRSNQKIGLPEMAILQGDQMASLAPLVRKELGQAIKKNQLIDDIQIGAFDAMQKWDGTLKGDSAAACTYESFIRTLTRRVLEPKLGAAMTKEYLQDWPRWSLFTQKILASKPKEWLPPEERTYETFMLTTFSEALKNIKVSSKDPTLAKTSWQSLHQIQWQPVFNSDSPLMKVVDPIFKLSPTGVGGDQDCVNACNVTASVDPLQFTCDSGPTQRTLIDMADPDKFYQSLTLGQSEHFCSAFRTDQLKNWLALQPHSVAFSKAQLERQQQHKVTLSNR